MWAGYLAGTGDTLNIYQKRLLAYRDLNRRPPPASAGSSDWYPADPGGPPEPSACPATSHRPPWLEIKHRRFKLLLLNDWICHFKQQETHQIRYVTFVLADFLDPGQRVDLHEGVGNTDDVHHIHHTLTDTHRDTVTEVKMCRVKEVRQTESWLFSFSVQIYSRTVREYKFDVPDLSIFFSEARYTPPQLGKKCCFLYCTESSLNWANWGQKSARSGLFCLWYPDGFRFVFIFNLAKTSMCTLKPDCVENWYL